MSESKKYKWKARGRWVLSGTIVGLWPDVRIEETGERYHNDGTESWSVELFWGYGVSRQIPNLEDEALPNLPKKVEVATRDEAKAKANAILNGTKLKRKLAPWQAKISKAVEERDKAWARKNRKRRKEAEREAKVKLIVARFPELGSDLLRRLGCNGTVRVDTNALFKLLVKLGMPSDETVHCCAECGNEKVEQALWTVLNTGEVNDAEGFGTRGNGGHYCGDCDTNDVEITRKSELEKEAS